MRIGVTDLYRHVKQPKRSRVVPALRPGFAGRDMGPANGGGVTMLSMSLREELR